MNLVEDVETLHFVKFRWIPFSVIRGEVENVSANQMPGWPSCLSYRPEKHILGRGRWDLASYQVSLNSIQQFQRRSRKCLSESKVGVAILFFLSAQKHKLGRERWDIASCQVWWNFVQRFLRRSKKCPSHSEAGRPSCFLSRPEKHKLESGRSQVSLNSVQRFLQEKSKISQPFRGKGGQLFFSIGQKNTDLVEDVEILLPVKFRRIPFRGFRREVENVKS